MAMDLAAPTLCAMPACSRQIGGNCSGKNEAKIKEQWTGLRLHGPVDDQQAHPLFLFVARLARLHNVVRCQAAALQMQGFFLARLPDKN